MATAISGLTNAITRELQRYNLVLQEHIDKISNQVTEDAVKELRSSTETPRLTGDYAAGWTRSKVKGKWIVHNSTDYQLTHLLEKGHARVGGGRVRAYVHIAPVARKAVEKFENEIDEIARARG